MTAQPSNAKQVLWQYAHIDNIELGEDKFKGHHSVDQALQQLCNDLIELLPTSPDIDEYIQTIKQYFGQEES